MLISISHFFPDYTREPPREREVPERWRRGGVGKGGGCQAGGRSPHRRGRATVMCDTPWLPTSHVALPCGRPTPSPGSPQVNEQPWQGEQPARGRDGGYKSWCARPPRTKTRPSYVTAPMYRCVEAAPHCAPCPLLPPRPGPSWFSPPPIVGPWRRKWIANKERNPERNLSLRHAWTLIAELRGGSMSGSGSAGAFEWNQSIFSSGIFHHKLSLVCRYNCGWVMGSRATKEVPNKTSEITQNNSSSGRDPLKHADLFEYIYGLTPHMILTVSEFTVPLDNLSSRGRNQNIDFNIYRPVAVNTGEGKNLANQASHDIKPRPWPCLLESDITCRQLIICCATPIQYKNLK